jgi:hypothetical protein
MTCRVDSAVGDVVRDQVGDSVGEGEGKPTPDTAMDSIVIETGEETANPNPPPAATLAEGVDSSKSTTSISNVSFS